MNSQQTSFSVKSTNKILNNDVDVNLSEEVSNKDQNTDTDTKSHQPKPKSNNGMVIRTNNTSVEDFY